MSEQFDIPAGPTQQPQRPMNDRVAEFLQGLATNGELGPDALANVRSLLESGQSRPMNARLAEALVHAQNEGKFGPDASANVRSLLAGTGFEDQIQ